jgi:hypothetical protein
VGKEEPKSELKWLRAEQVKSRQDEIFGGFSPAERAQYEAKSERIHKLESEIQAGAGAEQNARSTKAEQQWNKESETDTPQAEAHQPYRSREKGSTDTTANSRRQQAEPF